MQAAERIPSVARHATEPTSACKREHTRQLQEEGIEQFARVAISISITMINDSNTPAPAELRQHLFPHLTAWAQQEP
jgi:hypothetical protein